MTPLIVKPRKRIQFFIYISLRLSAADFSNSPTTSFSSTPWQGTFNIWTSGLLWSWTWTHAQKNILNSQNGHSNSEITRPQFLSYFFMTRSVSMGLWQLPTLPGRVVSTTKKLHLVSSNREDLREHEFDPRISLLVPMECQMLHGAPFDASLTATTTSTLQMHIVNSIFPDHRYFHNTHPESCSTGTSTFPILMIEQNPDKMFGNSSTEKFYV